MKNFSVVLMFLVVSTIGWSQRGTTEPKSGKHYGIESHDLWVKTKTAKHLKAQNSFYNAIDLLLEVHDSIPENEYVLFNLAELYYLVRDPKSAVEYYQHIVDPKKTSYPIAIFHYGEMLKQLAMYTEARQQFYNMTRYRDRSRSSEIRDVKKWARQEMRSCDFAVNLIDKDTAFVNTYNLPDEINYAYTDFSPMPWEEDKLVFASLQVDSVLSYNYGEEKFYPVKLYEVEKTGDTSWSSPQEFMNLNHEMEHTANATLDPDGKRLYYTRCHLDHHNGVICHIYYKNKNEDGSFGKPHKAHHKVNTHSYTSTQPTFGQITKRRRRTKVTETVMYFVSNRPGGEGGMDLWFTRINEKGKFSRPVNCGRRINTARDEVSPYYNNEEEIMYFSSNYHYGLGGFDIQATKGNTKRWRKTNNVGIPWNSSYDDTYYTPIKPNADTLATGYFVSNRPGGHALKSETCCDDIYTYEEYYPEIREIKGKVQELIAEITRDTTMLDSTNSVASSDPQFARMNDEIGQTLEDSLNNRDSLQRGIKEAEAALPVENARVGFVRKRHLEAATIEGKVDKHELAPHIEWVDTTGKDGDFMTRLYTERQYALVVDKEGYEEQIFPIDWSRVKNELDAKIIIEKEIIDTVSKPDENFDPEKDRQSLAQVIDKEEFEDNEKFVLENMYFDTNMDEIKKSSEGSLKLLLDFLKKKPNVKIEISGHTDNRGDEEYNMDLSQRRAESVKEYLIDNGISSNRLQAKGYGETNPIADNEKADGSDNPIGRRKNRRTEIVILSGGKK